MMNVPDHDHRAAVSSSSCSVLALRRLYLALLFVGAPFGALTGGLLVTHRPQWRSFPLLVLAGVWAAALAPLVLAPSLPATPLAGWAESIGPSAALAIGPASLVVAIGLLSGRR